MKIMASGPITSWEIDGETVETVSDFILGGSKSLQMVIAAMKLKDTYSLEGKLPARPPEHRQHQSSKRLAGPGGPRGFQDPPLTGRACVHACARGLGSDRKSVV